MRKILTIVATLAMTVGLTAGPALADPVVSHVQVGSAHTHHIHLGNGECKDIDSVYFFADSRGLHRGANASNGHDSGPFHGPCAQHLP